VGDDKATVMAGIVSEKAVTEPGRRRNYLNAFL
jgi:hypothetical protein